MTILGTQPPGSPLPFSLSRAFSSCLPVRYWSLLLSLLSSPRSLPRSLSLRLPRSRSLSSSSSGGRSGTGGGIQNGPPRLSWKGLVLHDSSRSPMAMLKAFHLNEAHATLSAHPARLVRSVAAAAYL